MLQLFDGFLQSNSVPFTRNLFLKSTGVPRPRRGPELQLGMLIRVCSCWRFGLLLSNWYSSSWDIDFFSEALRNTGAVPLGPLFAKWRLRVSAASDSTHAVKPSRMDETSSSKFVRISWSDRCRCYRCGGGLYWMLWMISGTYDFSVKGSSGGAGT